jgi:predicted transcriptional regulator
MSRVRNYTAVRCDGWARGPTTIRVRGRLIGARARRAVGRDVQRQHVLPRPPCLVSIGGRQASVVPLASDNPSPRLWYQIGIILLMAMTLRLTDEQTEALRRRAAKEDRSMQQVALAALDDYLLRVEDDEVTDRLAQEGAQRFAELLRRLGE